MKRLVEKIRRLKGGFDRFEYFLEKDYVINVNEDGYIHIRYFGITLNYFPKSNHVTVQFDEELLIDEDILNKRVEEFLKINFQSTIDFMREETKKELNRKLENL